MFRGFPLDLYPRIGHGENGFPIRLSVDMLKHWRVGLDPWGSDYGSRSSAVFKFVVAVACGVYA